jgi:hypothetical protein
MSLIALVERTASAAWVGPGWSAPACSPWVRPSSFASRSFAWEPAADGAAQQPDLETVAQALGAKDGLASHISEREMLLVLDNFERVIDAAPGLAAVLEACPNLKLPGERFWMLETIRENAIERLEASGEADELRSRHAEWFLARAEEAFPPGEHRRAGSIGWTQSTTTCARPWIRFRAVGDTQRLRLGGPL